MLESLIREALRAETHAIGHPVREARRIGDAPPVLVLREVADHAVTMRPRLLAVLQAHGVAAHVGTLGSTLATLRHLVIDHVVDAERCFCLALGDLRHGVGVVTQLRGVARATELFGVIRWCDDWLSARRTLVARVAAQLAWFAEQDARAIGHPPVSAVAPEWHADRTHQTQARPGQTTSLEHRPVDR